MANARSKVVTVSSIVGTKCYQIGVKDGYFNRPLKHPRSQSHFLEKNEWDYERGRMVGHYLRNEMLPVPKNRVGSKVTSAAQRAFINAQQAGYIL